MEATTEAGARGVRGPYRALARAGRRERTQARDWPQLARNEDALGHYLHDLSQLPLLNAKQEMQLARETQRLTVQHWQALLSYRPALDVMARAVAAHTPDASAELEALRASKKPATRSGAEQLRKLDFGGAALNAADAAVHEAFASDPRTRARAYLARVAQAKSAQRSAKGRFVAANLRLVISMARRYEQQLLPLADLIQEGNLGLMHAVERFDYRRGFRFSTYASWWIRHTLNRALSDKARVVRVPVHAFDDLTRVARARRAALLATGVEPSTDELAQRLDLPPERLERMRSEAVMRHPVSFDAPVSAERAQTLHDLLPADIEQDPEQSLDDSAWRVSIDQLLGTLTSMEAAILRFRFGIGGGDELTLKEIGLKYNLSRERIRQIQAVALTKLRERLQHDAAAA